MTWLLIGFIIGVPAGLLGEYGLKKLKEKMESKDQ